MATYSLSHLTVSSTLYRGVTAENDMGAAVNPIEDAAVNTPQQEQRYMQFNTPFLAQGPDGQQAWYTYDAERSIPGVLRVIRRV